jgi:hypothetical protein
LNASGLLPQSSFEEERGWNASYFLPVSWGRTEVESSEEAPDVFVFGASSLWLFLLFQKEAVLTDI